MRSFCIFVFALSLIVLTAALPLQLRVIHPKPVYVLGGLVVGSGHISAIEGPGAPSGFQTSLGSDILGPDHGTPAEISLETIVKSIKPVKFLKETYAEVTVYLQEFAIDDH